MYRDTPPIVNILMSADILSLNDYELLTIGGGLFCDMYGGTLS